MGIPVGCVRITKIKAALHPIGFMQDCLRKCEESIFIRGCHNRDKGTAENERLRDPKFIFSYPKNERLIFLCGRNAAQEEISTMRVG